jgi:transcriptional regulator with XRE-family HTH domain
MATTMDKAPTGSDLRAARRAARLSQRAVAEAMRIERRRVSNLEYLGPNRPDRRVSQRFLAAVDAARASRNGATA